MTMRGAYLRIAALLASATAATLVVACAADAPADADPPASPDGERDAAAPADDATAPDAAPTDSGVDAGPDPASPDAGDAGAEMRCSPENWCHTKLPKPRLLTGVWGDGEGVVWAVAQEGDVLRWDGSAWSIARAGATPLHAVWGSGPTDVWVASDTGLLHGSGPSSSALTWTEIALDTPIQTIWGTSKDDIWAGGFVRINYNTADGRLYRYSGGDADAAESWVVDPAAPTNVAYAKVWGTSPDDVWMGGPLGSGSAAFRRVADGDGGFAWRTEHTSTSSQFNSAGSITPTSVYLLGMGPPETYVTGASSDGGETFAWTVHDGFKTGLALRAVWSSSPNDIYLAGIRGRLRRFDGTSWSIVRIATDDVAPVIADLHAMWGSGPEDIWVVGHDIALHKSKRKGP